MIKGLLAAALVTWPSPWADKLKAHFGVDAPIPVSGEAVDALISEWVTKRPTPLEIVSLPQWQGDEVYLLDADACAKIAARLDLHSVFPLAVSGLRARAVLLGRKRFAFVYDAPVEYHLPAYSVAGSDSFGAGALNVGEIGQKSIYALQAFDTNGSARPVKGPLGVTLLSLTQEGAQIRARVKVFPDVHVKAWRVEPR